MAGGWGGGDGVGSSCGPFYSFTDQCGFYGAWRERMND